MKGVDEVGGVLVPARVAVHGITLIELIVVTVVSALLTQGTVSAFLAHHRAVVRMSTISEQLATARLARLVMGSEWRAWTDSLGAFSIGSDSAALRVARGIATSCGPAAPGGASVLVRAVGLREPDPAKDSVVWLSAGGGVAVAALMASNPSTEPCPGSGGRVYRWRLEPAPVDFRVGRYFERGSYHLTGGAVRYRRGRSGRQPLTPEVVSPTARFTAAALSVVLMGDTVPWLVWMGR